MAGRRKPLPWLDFLQSDAGVVFDSRMEVRPLRVGIHEGGELIRRHPRILINGAVLKLNFKSLRFRLIPNRDEV